ncbi:MAG: diacylglycerol/lipid kinase family protein [Candidatus Hermodarchaeia archaeon]|jgi:YegS/Rv2252/BmrU family lipid kinase
MSNAFLVFNPAAGRFPSRILTERAANVLRKEGWNIQLHQTSGGSHITELARDAVKKSMDAFFIAGGDGSINYAVAGLVNSEVPLGVLPAGTANVWSRELGLPGLAWTRLMALEESASQLANASNCTVDVGYCNNNPFLLWAGVGLDAFIVHRVEPRTRWEKHFAMAHYVTIAMQQASYWSGIHLDVMADNQKISGHYILGVVSNIHLYAGGYAEISPYARLDDGKMDLWLFAGETLMETFRHAWNLWSGRHLNSDMVQCIPFRKLQLSSNSQMYVQIDGEPVRGDGDVTIEVKPRALRVLVPKNAPRALFNKVEM